MTAAMPALVLETPRYLQIYDSDGHLLAALEIPTVQQARYISEEMLCRYLPIPNPRQNKFRNSLRTRDAACAITGPNAIASRRSPFRGLEATHVFPADYKIIVFVTDTTGIGGTRLRNSALSGTLRVSANLLRWHLRMCLYKSLKVNAEPQTVWEEDLGEDPMGEILSQPDAAERMEVELFTRLGELIA
ncbi:hypothetical protein DTO013E5_6248 [Penicillium roqueforti]|uniref:uncharacterized protein n=1 Tax=Penicillium roqueforti TaxID=5082 RepID=UPI00190D1DCD|nr:uncharacterized protein LCP9604111_5213 [Penicillium roqueforti]KAF9248463.1 hypothetical protein LCP9604111_5213 [Penicillium roqueforti]KAI1831090.1 hypothetical protein CBS147337_8156 [Penicillium roqueforti]KAI2674060.1 hypothetical protein CBS147355_7235 [Penicillium roqueforti]KAI2682175.1 hypothetical protein LCP963914a_6590 [Penicillium roqueforti]KAI2699309.1 hypothetical protein CBS147372_6556 [Penicillium roqueforti]